jgi:DNA-binding MarR family transcriptional regulator/GNAT superfamily N-acetyltransferase
MDRTAIDRIRSFNRLVTLRTGALDSSYLARGRPLGQARVLFEIGTEPTDIRALRERLGLDSGYLSRVVGALARQGMVRTATGPGDRRRRSVWLTPKGKAERAAYDELSDRLARDMLAPLSERQRERLVAAMAEVERLVTAGTIEIAHVDSKGEEARQCLAAYFAELSSRFEQVFDPARGVSPNEPPLAPPDGCFLVARLAGRAVGCGGLRKLEPGIGEIKRMWVAGEVRGLGLSRRLLQTLEARAAAMGMLRLRLDTNHTLAEAQALYRSAGYREIARFNDNPYADFWFEKQLTGS